MLEIAGGIVIGFLALGFVFVAIWLVACLFERFAGWFAILLTATILGAAIRGLLAVVWAISHWLLPGAGDMVFGLGVLAGVWLLFFDSLVDFAVTKVLWHSARHFAKRARPTANPGVHSTGQK